MWTGTGTTDKGKGTGLRQGLWYHRWFECVLVDSHPLCVCAHLHSYSTCRVSLLYKMEAANERTLTTQARAHDSESRHRNPAHGQSSAPIREKVLKRGGKRARSADRVQEEADTGVQPSAVTVNTEPAEATGEGGNAEQSSGQAALDTH